VDDQPTPIEFSTYVRQATRTTSSTTLLDVDALKTAGFNVSAMATKDNITSVYFSDLSVTYDSNSSVWKNSTTTHYWPTDASLSFYAFAPADAGTLSFSTSGKTLVYDASSQKDLLWAAPNTSTSSGNTVNFTFGHALACVIVEAKGIGSTETTPLQSSLSIKISKIEITGTSGNTAGTIDLSKSTSTDVWSSSYTTGAIAYEANYTTTTEITQSSGTITTDPITLIPGAITGYAIKLTYDVYENSYKVASNQTYTYTPTTSTLAINTKYTYTFSFGTLSSTDLKPIVYAATSVTDWATASETQTITDKSSNAN
jgi:hypothetical protein